MQKNTATKWVVFAWTTATNVAKTGDAAQITGSVRIDGGADNPIDDTNPTELAGGYYAFDITAAECNGDNIVIIPASSTSGVQVIGVPGAVWTEKSIDQTGDNYARIGAPAGASVSADVLQVKNYVDDIGAAGAGLTAIPTIANVTTVATTTNLTNLPAAAATAAELAKVPKSDSNVTWNGTALASINAEVDTAFTTAVADSYAAHEALPTREQALLEILQFLTEKSVSSTTVSVKKPDGSTAVMEFTLDSATAPTSITRKANP
jgi:hypothetical protein